MAIRIPRESIPPETRKRIAADLWLEETAFTQGVEKRTVQCFLVDGAYIRLPHVYGMRLFPEISRGELSREEICATTMRFRGSLLQEENRDQKTVAAEAWNHLMGTGSVLLNAFPGFGKTMLFTAIVCRLGVKAVVVCTQDRLIDQAMQTFRETTDARLCKLSLVKDAVSPEEWEEADVFFTTEKSCHKLGVYLDRIGTLVVDECHEFCSPTRVATLLSLRPRYVIACSASLQWKKDGLENAIWFFTGKRQTVTRKIGKRFYVMRYNCSNNIYPTQTRSGKLDYADYIRRLHADARLMDELMEMISKNIHRHKILVLVKNVDFVDRIRDQIVQRGIHPSPSVLRGTVRIYRDSRILIGTFSKIGTGFDPKSDGWDGVHFDMLMLVDSTRTTGLLEQLYGRVFRASLPIVVNWVYNNPIARGHFNAHVDWYRAYSNAVYLVIGSPVCVMEEIEKLEREEREKEDLERLALALSK